MEDTQDTNIIAGDQEKNVADPTGLDYKEKIVKAIEQLQDSTIPNPEPSELHVEPELLRPTKEFTESRGLVINQSAKKNPETGKWEGYVPKKGETPPWNPFDPAKRKNRVTLKERKFMALLSTTGSMQEAYRGTYKVKEYGNQGLERARVSALANQVLRRIRLKDPQLVEAMTFQDIDKDFVKKAMLDLWDRARKEGALMVEARIVELMGKTQQMFTDKIVSESKVTEVIKTVYKESDDDFPEKDERVGRLDLGKHVGN